MVLYGPASARKSEAEMDRLRTVATSIRKSGYRPDEFGDVEGYFIGSGPAMVFFVRGGKHRAAALASLGWEKIPVRCKPWWPRLVRREDADRFPLVLSGTMDRELASLITQRYVDGHELKF
jgi:hypothetical protein